MTDFINLALPVPLDRLFCYKIPESLQQFDWQQGMRVQVNFRNRKLTGIVWQTINAEDIDFPINKIKPIVALIDNSTLLGNHELALLQWLHQYYHWPIGECAQLFFAGSSKQGGIKQKMLTAWRLTEQGKRLNLEDAGSKQQAQLLSFLQQHSQMTQQTFKQHPFSPSSRQTLEKKQLIQKIRISDNTHLISCSASQLPPQLNQEQLQALERFKITDTFHCGLLFGVTGSGKTELFFHWINDCLRKNKQVLYLVPEIGLIKQSMQRLQSRIEAKLVTMHSGLSPSQRQQAWQSIQRGEANVLLGTRSALFTPFNNIGLIIIDEEHDGAYKQQDSLRYQARDTAIKFASIKKIPIILASATPAIESLHNAQHQRYTLLKLTQRAAKAQLPYVQTINIQSQKTVSGISEELKQRIHQHLHSGQQVLLFLNRRGMASSLICSHCGWTAMCSHCDARLTVHKHQLLCHHCQHTQPHYSHCPSCGHSSLQTLGLGTAASAEYLQQEFAGTPIFRLDRDSIQNTQQLNDQLNLIEQGDAAIIIGTQMLAKGHHFANITLVGVLDADAGLYSSDFRSEEKMSQLLMQVAGRSGREKKLGEVLIQTHHPEHPIFSAITKQDYAGFCQYLLQQRQLLSLPPYSFCALIQGDHHDPFIVEQTLIGIKQQFATLNVQCVGPLPAFLTRLANRYRFHLILKSSQRSALHLGVSQIEQLLRQQTSIRWFIDIDPVELG